MILHRLLGSLAAMLIALVSAASAGHADTETMVRFRPGAESAGYSGRIRGDGTSRYVIDARGGQVLRVALRADNGATYFNVLAAGSAQAMFVGSESGNRFSGSLPRTGRYVIEVYLMRAAARRGEVSNFTLDIAIPASSGGGGGDFADGDAGGPDGWQVSGVPAGDRLSVRDAPSASAAIIGRLRNGEVVRNLGCRRVDASRWCRIAGGDGLRGWVNGRFLVEAAGGYDPGDSDPGTSGDATVRDVKCKESPQDCLRKAEAKCNGSYRTLDSESHAGGILDDRIPGPVTWYSLTYQCGYADGRRPGFPWRGPRYNGDYGGNDAGMPLDARAMRESCRSAASMAFSKQPDHVQVMEAERTGDGYAVFGQFRKDGITNGFVCSFNRAGMFRHVYRQ